ncbi:MAG: hypothetical protein CMI18_02290 [Opitutaceae bacterium]|nr:hypothetical protein [Opitutaceae bacterium]
MGANWKTLAIDDPNCLPSFYFWQQNWLGLVGSLFIHGTVGIFSTGIAAHELRHGTGRIEIKFITDYFRNTTLLKEII